jgi:hypothetical protein
MTPIRESGGRAKIGMAPVGAGAALDESLHDLDSELRQGEQEKEAIARQHAVQRSKLRIPGFYGVRDVR